MQYSYNPNRLIDFLLAKLHLESDAALSRKLRVAEKVLKKIRRCELPVTASMLLWMQEVADASVEELRRLLGDRRARLRVCRISS